MKQLLTNKPIALRQGLAIVRIIVGALMTYHGLEVFNSQLMRDYAAWDSFAGSNALLLVYLGKGSEFIAGISLLLGLFTRLGSVLTMGTMSYITFFVGGGKFWYEDQHPFMFVLFGLLFLLTGSGALSVDDAISKDQL